MKELIIALIACALISACSSVKLTPEEQEELRIRRSEIRMNRA